MPSANKNFHWNLADNSISRFCDNKNAFNTGHEFVFKNHFGFQRQRHAGCQSIIFVSGNDRPFHQFKADVKQYDKEIQAVESRIKELAGLDA